MKTPRRSLELAFAAILIAISVLPALAKDEWIQVRSKNFFLIGNASEKDIRKVATRLEQFRETFRSLFSKTNLTSPIATNVIVFKSASAYTPFKPRRADGTPNERIAGYFQPGSDVNYITLSTEGDDAETFGLIFHEYVHFIVETNFGKSEIPAWFNEGLAEYYSTFEIAQNQTVKLGLPLQRHLYKLQLNPLIPLDELFNTSNYELHRSGNHSTSMFYAESWALVHYMLTRGRTDSLQNFVRDLSRGETPKTAFERAFNITYAEMEAELHKYVIQTRFSYNEINFTNKLLFDNEMTSEVMPESLSNAYLGDLLVHTNRPRDAEPFLQAALKIDPNSSLANAASGMAMLRQKKFDEARTFLEKAVAVDRNNHLALYWYAYLLSKEAGSDFGMVRHFDADITAKMRAALTRAIELNPTFADSYELLAYVDLVNEEKYDEALDLLYKALRSQPGNQAYALRQAEVLARQKNYVIANNMAETIAKTSDDPEIRSRADILIQQINRRKEYEANASQPRGDAALFNNTPVFRKGGGQRPLTEEELARRQENATLFSITQALRKLKEGEDRIIGHVEMIDCGKNVINYTVKTATGPVVLTSKNFQDLVLHTFDAAANGVSVGCDSNLSALNAVVTFYVATGPKKAGPAGELLSIEFVPTAFRYVNKLDDLVRTQGTDDPMKDPEKRAGIVEAIRKELRTPAAGQKREMGYLEKIECTNKGIYYNFRTSNQLLRLIVLNAEALQVRLFNRDLGDLDFGCNLRPMDVPAVFIYTDKPDDKTAAAGEILSIDFVPNFFTLQ
jgi:tetratricopeptide (TPR) repeat protein